MAGPGFLAALSPGQRQIAMYAVPGVAIAALFASRKKSTAAAVQTVAAPAANPDAISTGELAQWQSQVTDVLNTLGAGIYDLQNSASASPAATQPATNQQPAPTTTQARTTTQAAPLPSYVGATAETVGAIPVGANYGYTSFPTTAPVSGGSVAAPSGGTFLYGQWTGNVLTSATYQLPDGSFTTVG